MKTHILIVTDDLRHTSYAMREAAALYSPPTVADFARGIIENSVIKIVYITINELVYKIAGCKFHSVINLSRAPPQLISQIVTPAMCSVQRDPPPAICHQCNKPILQSEEKVSIVQEPKKIYLHSACFQKAAGDEYIP